MTTANALQQLIHRLPEDRLRQLLEYGEFLAWQEERTAWHQAGQQQFARAFGDDEPEYTVADLKSESKP